MEDKRQKLFADVLKAQIILECLNKDIETTSSYLEQLRGRREIAVTALQQAEMALYHDTGEIVQ